ncbi:MAG: hypothetical protein JWN75_3 [Candidatus Saccharibacteria bacterium]|nr:hypothetical protein [Candidatus Saccharibacteria bacterium]
MNVLKRMGRKASRLLSIGVAGVIAAGVLLLGPMPTAAACYASEPNCGGYGDYGYYGGPPAQYDYGQDRGRCPDWQEWRNDNPGDPRGGCVDLNQQYNIWIKHSGWQGYTWYLDRPGDGRWNGLDLGPDCQYGNVNDYRGYTSGNIFDVLVAPGFFSVSFG